MALRGLKVLEMAGLAPAPYCGMILSDFGADVIRVDRARAGAVVSDTLCRGKRSIAVDLKQKEGVDVIKTMAGKVDVIVEPFRRGVMEKLGLGPDVLMKKNPRLIFARLTGFGQEGPLADRAGHDINYLAISGTLSVLGRAGQKPFPPVNTLADFAGGGLICALGIAMALIERGSSNRGQVIDANMVEGAAYVASFLWSTRHMPLIGQTLGTGWLDSGAPWYNTYKTKDGLFMSVGAIEPQFYAALLKDFRSKMTTRQPSSTVVEIQLIETTIEPIALKLGLGLSQEDYPQFDDWPKIHDKFTELFESKTQKEWTDIFEDTDACCMPVVPLHEAGNHRHNVARDSFITDPDGGISPKPAPLLSVTPAIGKPMENLLPGQHSSDILQEFGFNPDETRNLIKSGCVVQSELNSKL